MGLAIENCGSGPSSSSTVDQGRRRYPRYPIELDAVINAAGVNKLMCTIRDFCTDGMLLQYKQRQKTGDTAVPSMFAIGDVLTIRCLVPSKRTSSIAQFKARVVRTVENGAGIAFLNPEHRILQIMLEFAAPSHIDKSDNLRKGTAAEGGRTYNDILADCVRLIDEALGPMLLQIDNRLASHLFDLSRNTHDLALQNDLFSASQTLHTSSDKLFESLRSGVRARLDKPPCLAPPPDATDLSFENLSLLQDENLAVWLAVSDTAGKVEEKYKEPLVSLEQRLSVLFDTSITHANNPYGPALFSESFQEAISQFSFSPAVNKICHEVLKEVLITTSGTLYDRINAKLIEHGILPDLKYKVVRSDGAEARPDPVQALAPDVLAAPAPSASTTPPPPPQHLPHRAATPVAPDAYQVVQELRELRREIIQHPVPAAPGARTLPPALYHNTADVVAAVSELQQSGAVRYNDAAAAPDVKSLVLDALTRRSGVENQVLTTGDSNTLELVGDVFRMMLDDPLVTNSVRPWLRRLELPTLRLALQDHNVFVDPSHVARKVVNKIAQLEFYDEDVLHTGQSAIRQIINSLLERIDSDDGATLAAFDEIVHQLDKLTGLQEQAFDGNVLDVVRTCEECPPTPDDIQYSRVEDAKPPEAEHARWCLHARRLRPSDWVSRTITGELSQRMCVAWVGQSPDIIVCVDTRGLHSLTLSLDDAAKMLRCGMLTLLDNGTESAMDRAQYSIMQELYQQVLQTSTHDSLTGLLSRREFERRLGEAIARAKQSDLRHILCFIDIDKFSVINNSCGYAAGDRLLTDIAGLLKRDLPEHSIMARLGSDEFGLLLENCTLDDALALSEGQIEAANDYRLEWDDNRFGVSISIGLVPVNAGSTETGGLLQAAESSCSVAKDVGGGRLQVYHSGHARIACRTEMMKWVSKIDNILAEDRLELNCQRIQPIADDSTVSPHYEILLRVIDDVDDITAPNEFIHAAEWYRRMPAIDRWVVTHALEWMAAHPEEVTEIGGLAINLSGQSLTEPGFAEFILDEISRTHVPSEKVCFEITETVGISNISDAALFIDTIHKVGCKFALDDFGSGMSSYGYLKNLPVDLLKIDGAFIKNLTANSSDYAVVKSIVEIARFMRKKVVAEFVENETILELLRDLGVDYAQGYMFDKPGPLDKLCLSS